jgi:hypothetical protein
MLATLAQSQAQLAVPASELEAREHQLAEGARLLEARERPGETSVRAFSAELPSVLAVSAAAPP